ncbi:MAG: hypothetical protein KAW40_03130, partial [Candidatus Aenigmarchaeota archaeon]|nr:hypothetical protein [Candidatus Aenigmarchaeota archaeon]
NNYYDVRMGSGHYLTAIDSEIDEDKIGYGACGSTDQTLRYILRQSSYNLKIKDTAGNALENLTAAARDLEGRLVFNISTYANGTVAEQILDFRKIQVDSETAQPKAEYTAHEFYYRKYGYKYFESIASMEDPITLDTVLFDSPCTALNETPAANQTGITYNPPPQHEFGEWDEAQVVGTDDEIVLSNTPVTQSEHFQILNITGINMVRLVPIQVVSKNDYSVNYENGTVNFVDGYETVNVTPVYFYEGNITLNETKNTSRIYDYMQAIQVNYSKGEEYLTDVFMVSDDCGTYISYIDIVLNGSAINETNEKKINIEDGYGFSATSNNGTTVNIISDTWNFTWYADNGTFFRKYTLDVTVKYGVNPVENATVKLTDTNGDTVFEINTSSDGTIPTQEVTYAQYNETGNETFSPFTLTVTKSPYNTYSAPLDIDRKTFVPVPLSLPCNPDLGYEYEVLSGDDENTNRSADAENLTLSVLVNELLAYLTRTESVR